MGAKGAEVDREEKPNQKHRWWKRLFRKLWKRTGEQDWWEKLFRRLCKVRRACCCSLYTGTLVIGWLFVVSATFVTLATFFGAAIQMEWIWLNPKPLDANEKLDAYYKTVPFIVMVMTIATAIVSILLLIGAYNGMMLLVKIWLQTNLVLFAIGILFGIANFVVQVGLNDTVLKMMGSLSTVVISEVILIYLIIVVKSYYVEQVDAGK